MWIYDNCNVSTINPVETFSVIIIPGDIGTEIDQITKVFDILTQRYDLVCYVPGNHEAWKRGVISAKEYTANYSTSSDSNNPGNREAADSLVKLKLILDIAKSFGVAIGPVRIHSQNSSSGLVIYPMYSWYHSGWDTELDLTHPDYLAVEKAIPFNKKWGDFALCGWPEDLIKSVDFVSTDVDNDNTTLAEAFGWLSESHLYSDRYGSPLIQCNDTVISFSHFLPHQSLCPEKRFLLEPLLCRVIGSDPLAEQVVRLKPHLHLFGHTHIPIDLIINDIRYIQWPLGYHRESTRQCHIVHSSGPLLVYDSSQYHNNNHIPNDSHSLDAVWSEYYNKNTRDPSIVNEISPWLQKRLDSFSGFVR
eukprot:gene17375-22923_t